MIDIDKVRDRPHPGRLFPDPGQFAAIENKGDLEGFERREFADDPVASREKTVILRRPVLIIDGDLFPEPPQHMGKGQFRADGIPVRADVGGHQNALRRLDAASNFFL